MVTLAALCLAQGLDMQAAGETELARIWTKVEAIRAKQAAKPKHSPLPAAVPKVVADERAAQRERVHAKVLAMPDSDMGNLIGPPMKCELPPDGWYCTRMPGHEGPCAALAVAPVHTAPIPSEMLDVTVLYVEKPAAAPVQAGTSDNDPWLTLAHIICADADVPPGHITDRLKELRDKLEAPVQEQEPVSDTTLINSFMLPADHAHLALVAAARSHPVQPVAVPDGWRIVEKSNCHLLCEGNMVIASLAGPEAKDNAAIIARLLAAPAAQDDAKDAERYRWLRDKSEPGICAFYLSVGKAFDGVKFNQATVDEAIDAQIAAIAAKAAS